MNIHHLELFYYVAKHGGISEAVRNIPYGIQQPAVSAQILQLEQFLGITLFNRRPFALTPPGDKLYRFIQPFFDNLESVADELQGGAAHQIRIGASDVVLRDHLPQVLQTVRKKFPKLKLILREGYQPQLESWLQRQELDMAITLLENKPPAGINSMALMKLPLVLLVNKTCRLSSADELWKRDKIDEPFICPPANEAICKHFQHSLSQLGIDWYPSIEVSSIDLIQSYVAHGYGIGLTVAIPKANLSKNIRALPLDGFSPVSLGVLWQGKMNPLTQSFLDEIQKYVKQLTS